MGTSSAPGPSSEHPLRNFPTLTPGQVQVLRAQWIETAEAFLGTASTPAGREGLARLLSVSDEELQRLLEKARELVGPGRADGLSQPTPGGPLGSLLTEEQKHKFGLK
jgi:hypothetical protein